MSPIDDRWEFSYSYNFTLVPCSDSNCISCVNETCDSCVHNYIWNSSTLSCETGPDHCSTAYKWNNDSLSCELIPDYCSQGYKWSEEASSCVLIPQECPTAYQWNHYSLSCEIILFFCGRGDEWNNDTSSCVSSYEECSIGYEWSNSSFECEPTRSCPTSHEWSNDTSSCVIIPQDCTIGYEYSNFSLSCAKINGECSTWYQWKIEKPSCEFRSQLCAFGYEWSKVTSSCVIGRDQYVPFNELPYDSTQEITLARSVTGIGIVLGILIAFVSDTSAQDSWSIINFLQLVLVLPLIALAMASRVREFIISNMFAALSIYVLPMPNVNIISLLDKLSFHQPDEYLRSLGWFSGSTLINNLMLLCTLLVLGIIHLICYLLCLLIKNQKSLLTRMILKVYQIFTFSVYIRIAIEVYMFTILMLFSEIKYNFQNGNDKDFENLIEDELKHKEGNYESLCISFVLLLLSFMFLLFVFFSWRRNKDHKFISKIVKARELYSGIINFPERLLYQRTQDNQGEDAQSSTNESHASQKIRIARLYTLLFLVRRLILIIIAVFMKSSDSAFMPKMCLLLTLQSAYLVYVIFIRSFNRIKDQVTEVLNELTYLVLLILLIKYDQIEEWTKTATNVFIYVILWQLSILLIMSIIGGVIRFIKYKSKHPAKVILPDIEDAKIQNESVMSKIHAKHLDARNEEYSQDKSKFSQGSNSFSRIIHNDKESCEEEKGLNEETESDLD